MARPPKPPGEKYETPIRRIGRVPDAEWQQMQAAAKASGKTFTQWATDILLRSARMQARKTTTKDDTHA